MKKWEVSNLGSYSWVFGPQLRTIPILNDILTKAEGAINGTNPEVANLRFGHDSYLGPLTVLMGINGADKDPEDPREVKYIYAGCYHPDSSGQLPTSGIMDFA